MSATPATDALETRFRRLSALSGAAGMLGWDQHVLMPSGGAQARAEQLATLSVLRHELLTAPAVVDDLAAAQGERVDGWRAANLAEMRRTHAHATALSSDLVEALSRAGSRCEALWREARAKADFSLVRDAMADQIRLIREEAAAKADALGTTPYEALLDGYEPGGSISKIEALFAELEAELPPLLEAVLERQAREGDPVQPEGPFPVATQRILSRRVMETLGFDFNHGRLDETLHPFCGGVPDDVRVTTRYDETGFINGIMGVIHETGHALYERGLPADWRGQPVGEARGMVMHESQSLLMEMQACRSPAFLGLLSGWARTAFGADGPAWEPENLRRIYTRVARSFIRVEADEVTYPLHVILRTRLERAMLSGDLEVADLPGAWNAGMRDLLGVTPPDDARGCLQDIHWYDGAVGYFPTYTLGAMAAAQLFQAAVRAEPGIPEAIGRGDFTPLVGWLRQTVHGVASSKGTEEILTAATGAELSAAPFLAHLKARYLEG
ncbi:carboxypeptidase M32 [Thalassobaculum sp. OXR-137]|uniref:carboxypeptidase M32 n=1 Tax=Thalassobaculum sp. OXR-137 TaxID=3100173 RepID=UPI002AC9A65D|nr:carboxypeptidase M32 [Thalassobaculum sp. OXR-137]WPZ35690.1 carboxypeptidase M32 [Thalassobaculum sp. OXR-137]